MIEILVRVTPHLWDQHCAGFTGRPHTIVFYGNGDIERAIFSESEDANTVRKYKSDMFELELVIPRITELEEEVRVRKEFGNRTWEVSQLKGDHIRGLQVRLAELKLENARLRKRLADSSWEGSADRQGGAFDDYEKDPGYHDMGK